MRESKFRGKRIDNGEWVFGNLIGIDVIVGDIVEWDNEYFNTEFWLKVDPETVGQLTGLTDRNGKEIYEGDIDGSDEPMYVAFEEGSFGLKFKDKPNYFDPYINWWNVDVIGNIYENGNLLDG